MLGRLKSIAVGTISFFQISFTKKFYNSREYLSKDLEQIPIEERFIYQYLKDKRANQTEEEASDAESVTSEDFNEALDNIKHDDVDFASNVNDAELEKSDSEDEEMELDGEVNLTSLTIVWKDNLDKKLSKVLPYFFNYLSLIESQTPDFH